MVEGAEENQKLWERQHRWDTTKHITHSVYTCVPICFNLPPFHLKFYGTLQDDDSGTIYYKWRGGRCNEKRVACILAPHTNMNSTPSAFGNKQRHQYYLRHDPREVYGHHANV
ncbi:hypothetical protein CHS0354_039144 [Potamilus streckersoni]|uniref:Uncharacterized protein n=1 Tax=Potamilus streckersoni TaxID=2493646 RepID=A0AAE0S7I9_9BIVA|nr:hypothetical protein CHS0354_039144 [Potamilus streckersoni]